MKKKFRLKSELFWVLQSQGIEVYYNNKEMNKLINTNQNEEFFNFLEFLAEGQYQKDIDNYSELAMIEKKEILDFLETNRYGLWETHHNHTRTEYFINTIPETDFNDHKKKIESVDILIIGLGTAGSYILELLTKLGFKNFTLIDGDIVEEKNLDSQNYIMEDVGKYKAEVLNKKYQKSANIKYYKLFIRSFYELSTMVNVNNFDFIINGADQLSVMQSLLSAKIEGNINATLIEGGYGVLQQTAYMIKDVEQAKLIKKSLDSVVLDSERWIVNNNGSIFNAIFSGFAISKMIFDDVLGLDSTEIAFSDFLQNRYFVGSKSNKFFYDEYSDVIQENMKFKSEKKELTDQWIPTITKKNILSIKPNYDIESTLSLYEKEFLLKESNNPFFEVAEYKADEIQVSSKKLDKNSEEKIMKLFTSFILNNFGESLYQRINKTLSYTLIESKQQNIKKQSKTIKLNQTWIVFNTSFENNLEKILGRIHELLHVVYWDVTSNTYEHERFVMENEIKFLEGIKNNDESTTRLFKYYLANKLNLFAKNYTISHYEKSIIVDKLPNFQIEFNDLTKNRLNELVMALNKQIKYDRPFYQLKYLYAFEKNQNHIENIINEF